jgi:hypothetical protein
MAELRKAINDYYQTAKQHTVRFLEKFGYSLEQWQALSAVRVRIHFFGVRGI